jgi:hypothetical protein
MPCYNWIYGLDILLKTYILAMRKEANGAIPRERNRSAAGKGSKKQAVTERG